MTNVPPHPETPTVDAAAPPEPPPESVAGVGALVDPTDEPGFECRGRRFRVADDVPSMTFQRITSDGRRVEKLGKRVPRQEDGVTPVDPTATVDLMARNYDALVKCVHVDDREEFMDYVDELEPAIGPAEQVELTRTIMEACAGRPTVPSPS
jgi:hypothetical protein